LLIEVGSGSWGSKSGRVAARDNERGGCIAETHRIGASAIRNRKASENGIRRAFLKESRTRDVDIHCAVEANAVRVHSVGSLSEGVAKTR
jgi:hypothetical protein